MSCMREQKQTYLRTEYLFSFWIWFVWIMALWCVRAYTSATPITEPCIIISFFSVSNLKLFTSHISILKWRPAQENQCENANAERTELYLANAKRKKCKAIWKSFVIIMHHCYWYCVCRAIVASCVCVYRKQLLLSMYLLLCDALVWFLHAFALFTIAMWTNCVPKVWFINRVDIWIVNVCMLVHLFHSALAHTHARARRPRQRKRVSFRNFIAPPASVINCR